MSQLALTNVYLEAKQKKALAQKAKSNGTSMSLEIRGAVDAYLAGVTVEELKLLDAATLAAERDITEINQVLDAGHKRAEKFFKDIAAVKRADAKANQ